jgi:F-type H+-transporting ATPase subunit c
MDSTALVIGLKAIGAGLVMVGTFGPGLGLGIIGGLAALATARQPQASGAIMAVAITIGVLDEAVAIYSMLIGLVILFVL